MNADKEAQEASSRYDAFCTMIDAAILGSVRASIDNQVFTSPMQKVNAITSRYIEEETKHLSFLDGSISSRVNDEVSSYYGSKPEKKSESSVPFDNLRVALVLQAQKIASSADTTFRQFQINAMNNTKTGMSQKKAMQDAANRVGGADRDFSDRRGKVWKGNVYVRTLWRQAYVWTEASATLSAIADHKKSLAVIVHPEADHKSNGVIVSVSGADGLPTWEQVRDKHFHPNSRAKLEPYGD